MDPDLIHVGKTLRSKFWSCMCGPISESRLVGLGIDVDNVTPGSCSLLDSIYRWYRYL